MLEWDWTFGVGGGSPYAGFWENRMVVDFVA
jgi:hypothetical protein